METRHERDPRRFKKMAALLMGAPRRGPGAAIALIVVAALGACASSVDAERRPSRVTPSAATASSQATIATPALDASPTPAVMPAAAPPTRQELQALGQKLRSDVETQRRDALVDPEGSEPFAGDPDNPVVSVQLLPEEFAFTDPDSGHLDAVVVNSAERSAWWTVELDHTSAGWKVASAAPRPVTVPGLIITEDAVGPLRIGMTAQEALATGFVYRTNLPEEFSCGTRYASVGLPGILVDFRDGSQDLLDSILIKEPDARTAEGFRVGTDFEEIRAHYGARLERLQGVEGTQFGVRGDGSHLIFVDYADHVVGAIAVTGVPGDLAGGC